VKLRQLLPRRTKWSLRVVESAVPLDSNWLRANPLPAPENETDKNGRGRVLAIGGGRLVPGGIMLTVEAALRAGAGKIQVATAASASLAIGVAMPEIAVLGLPENADGEIDLAENREILPLISRCDCLVVGPAMSDPIAASGLLGRMIAHVNVQLVLDAAVLINLKDHAAQLKLLATPAVLTPHIGEMTALLNWPSEEIETDRAKAALEVTHRYGAICAFKGATTVVSAPGGALFNYAGGGVGLATAGSGDVLAGIVAGLCARGADPLQATLWAVWLHGEAGRRCAEQIGPLGFLARELLAKVPKLMIGQAA